MGMGMGMAVPGFGAVSPELGYRQLTLQFYLGPNAPPDGDFPKDVLPQASWSKRTSAFDHNLFALTLLPEFVRVTGGNGWEHGGLDLSTTPYGNLLQWLGTGASHKQFVEAELEALQVLMQNDRERYLPEIVAQHDNAPAYWLGLLGLERGDKALTLRVLHLALRIGELVAVHYKLHYDRPRPSALRPGLMPPFGPPAHPAFPSGHSTQAWLMSLFLARVTPQDAAGQSIFKSHLDWLATRVAFNRERGGFHYRSDSQAGEVIARRCYEIANDATRCPKIVALFDEARAEEWS